MALPEHEPSVKRKEVLIPRYAARMFLSILGMRQSYSGYSIHSLRFNEEAISKEKDGTRHITVKPVVTEEVDKIGHESGMYLVRDKHDILNYLVEFETLEHPGSVDYFVGITQVPSITKYEDLGEWVDKVSSRRVMPARYRHSSEEEDYPPSIAITSSHNRISVELFEEDFNLEELYELLAGEHPSATT